MTNILHEISIRSLKMVDIAFLFILSSFIGYIVARIFSRVFVFKKESYIKNEKGEVILKCKIKLGMQILLEMGLIGVILYLSRQIMQMVPFPGDGWKGISPPSGFAGYVHKNVREYGNPYPILFFIFIFQDQFRNKVLYFTEINKF
jgi:hypothetical protein